MPNRRPHDHIGSFNFMVEIEGVTQGAFISVDGLQAQTEVIEYKDGADIILRKRPGRTRYGNITLRRGYTANSELWDWYRKTADGKLERKAGSVILADDAGGEIERYNFFEAWPCRWCSYALDGGEPGALFEEIELVVEKIEHG